jgi:ankyrin repeat protein
MEDIDFMDDISYNDSDYNKNNGHDTYKDYGLNTTDSDANLSESNNPEKTKIKRLLNLDDWDQIIKMVEQGSIDATIPVTKGKTLVKLAIIQRRIKFIKKMIEHKPDVFLHTDYNSGTPLHIAAKHGYWDILKMLLPICKTILNYRGIAEENFIFHVDSPEILEWCLKNYPEIDMYMTSKRGRLYIADCIAAIKINDEYRELAKILIARMDPTKIKNELMSYPPLHTAATFGYLDIVKLLIEKGHGVNSHNNKVRTPLHHSLMAVHSDVTKYLIEQGADISDCGAENWHNPYIIAINRGDIVSIKLMLNKDTKPLHIVTPQLHTPAHILFKYKRRMPADIMISFITKSDMNFRDVAGTTPLNLLFKYHGWKPYSEVLKTVKIDIFNENSSGITPLDHISKKELLPFMDIVAHSYLHILNKIKECDIKKITNACRSELKTIILNTKKSIPEEDDTLPLKHPRSRLTSKGTFLADLDHGVYYTVIMLQRYQELSLPSQFFFYEKLTERFNIKHAAYPYPMDKTIRELMMLYRPILFELTPALILWGKRAGKGFIDPDLDFYILKPLLSDKVKFVIIRLTLVGEGGTSHANILLFDKENCRLERFDPYGGVPYGMSKELDEYLEANLGILFNDFCKKKQKKLVYLRPIDYMGKMSLQSISNDERYELQKHGDPGGYCLAWVYWYVEMRIKNPELHPKELIKRSISHILKNNKTGHYGFIDYARNYAGKLDEDKNKLLANAGVKEFDYYNLVPKDDDVKKIRNHLIVVFNKLIGDRL